MELTVLVSRGVLASGIRQTMEDFVLFGLVRDLVWIDADTFSGQSTLVTSMGIDDGSAFVTRESLQEALQRFHPERISYGCINVVDESDGLIESDTFGRLLEPFFDADLHEGIARTNLMIGRVGGPIADPLPVIDDTVNLMFAPEDSLGPKTSARTYDARSRTEDFTLHCAAGVASVFGIWHGVEGNPAREFPLSRDGNFHLVRSYYRRIDGQDVQQQLKVGVLDTNTNPLPVSQQDGNIVYGSYTHNKTEFTKKATAEFMHIHGGKLRGQRFSPKAEGTERVSAGKAIGTFVKTFATNFVSHPGRVISTLTAEGKRSAELKLQEALYGMSGSRVQVGDGARSRVTGAQGNKPQTSAKRDDQLARELRDLWRTYVNMSLSMVDGEPRSIADPSKPSLPEVVGDPNSAKNVRVARSANDVVPGPGCHFGRDLPNHLLNAINLSSVAPYDAKGAERFQQSLGDRTISRHREIPQIINDFQTWNQEHSDSFANLVGQAIIGTRQNLERELADLRRRLEELQARQRSEMKRSKFAALMQWSGWVAILSLVFFLISWLVANQIFGDDNVLLQPQWLVALNIASGTTLALFFGIWILLWLIFFSLQIASITVEQIRLLNLRDQYLSELEAARKNVESCEEALRRCDIAYKQFLSVSDIVGSVLQYPFGTVRYDAVATVSPATRLPDSVLLAEARPDKAIVEEVAQRYRRDIYHTGWLDGYFRIAEQKAVADIDEEEGRIDNDFNIDSLFSQLGRGSNSMLDLVARRMSDPDFFGTDRSKDLWKRISDKLERDESKKQLLRPLATAGGQILGEDRLIDFVTSKNDGRFNGSFITAAGDVANFQQVSDAYIASGTSPIDCLGSSRILVQISRSGRRDCLVAQEMNQSNDVGNDSEFIFDDSSFDSMDSNSSNDSVAGVPFLTEPQHTQGHKGSPSDLDFLDDVFTNDL